MVPSAHRLRRARDIATVQRRGRYAVSGPLSLKVYRNRLQISRVVVVVSKKVDKRAAVRNRIRRRIAAVLASEWATVPVGYDIVITVQADIADRSATELKRLVSAVLTRGGII